MKTIYTIGYSGFSLESFKNVLLKNRISCVIDVRSNPVSNYFQDYNSNNLEPYLKKYNIIYRNYGPFFGARQKEVKYYPNGYLDFNLFTNSERFQEGLKRINAGIDLKYSFVLMCAEKDPFDCHRAIMISRVFHDNGFEVKHILADESFETQEMIEQKLVDRFFPNRNQLSLFSGEETTQDLIKKGYDLRNKEIGYRIKEEDDYE